MALSDIEVPGYGDPDTCYIMLVGEGPGKQEARQREPFVGKVGGMVTDLITSNGLTRGKDVFLTNATRKMPPKGKKDSFFFQNGSPTKDYMEGIVELVKEIKRVEPNVIGAFGKYALWALTQHGLRKHDKITNWRGSIMESTLVEGMKIIPMIHPSWFLRGQLNKLPLLDWDFQKLVRESKSPEINLPNPDFIVDPTPEQIQDAIDRFTSMEEGELLTVDTEWYNPESLAYIGFSDDKDFAISIPSNSMLAYRAYKKILDAPVGKVMQNAMFDDVALDRVGIEVRNVKHDTMIMFHSCFMDLGQKGLDTIASVLTDHPYYKEDLEFVGSDDEKGMEYNCTDCVVTHEAANVLLKKEFPAWGAQRGYEISMSIYDTFSRASKMGILCDMEALQEIREENFQEADRYQEMIEEVIGHSFNTRSWQQVRSVVYEELGYGKDYEGRSTAQDKLMDMAASDGGKERAEVLEWIIRVRQNLNENSRYMNEDIVDRDGRIRCNWNLAGTRNGRLSTSDPWWNGTPIQTIPKPPAKCRRVFRADPGHVFIGWDLEQADAYVVAVKTRDYELLTALEEGKDIHSMLGAQLGVFDMDYDDFMRRIAEDGKDEVPERYLSKKCRHSLNYYGTWYTLKKSINKEFLDTGVGIDAATAKVLREAYIEVSPGIEGWWDEVYRTIKKQKYLINAYGRRRNFFGWITKFKHSHRDGIAYYPQSSVADSTTQAIAEMDQTEWMIPLAHMHDGGFCQIPEDRIEEGLEIMRRATYREMIVDGEVLEIPIELKVGRNWLDMTSPEKFEL